MAELKPSITVSNKKIIANHNNYSLDIKVPPGKGWFGSGLELLIKKGYLSDLIECLRDGRDCFVLSEFPDDGIEENKETKEELASWELIYSKPRKSFCLIAMGGWRIYWVAKNVQSLSQLPDTLGKLFSFPYITVFLLFENKQKGQELYEKIKTFTRLKDKFIVPLVSDIIKLDIGCCSAEESIEVFSNRITKEEFNDKFKEFIKTRRDGVELNERI